MVGTVLKCYCLHTVLYAKNNLTSYQPEYPGTHGGTGG